MNPMSESPPLAPGKTSFPVSTASFEREALRADVSPGGVTLLQSEKAVLSFTQVPTLDNTLAYQPPQDQDPAREAHQILAALEGWLAYRPALLSVDIQAQSTTAGLSYLLAAGLLQPVAPHHFRCQGALLWQHAALWLPNSLPPYPQQHVTSAGGRHPRRPARPASIFTSAISLGWVKLLTSPPWTWNATWRPSTAG